MHILEDSTKVKSRLLHGVEKPLVLTAGLIFVTICFLIDLCGFRKSEKNEPKSLEIGGNQP